MATFFFDEPAQEQNHVREINVLHLQYSRNTRKTKISGFIRGVNDICPLLGCYAA